MHTKDILKQLTDLFSGVACHPEFNKELLKLLQKDLSGKESKFFTMLVTQLSNIRTFSTAINKVDGNEILKGLGKPYYSIHFKSSQFNIRFIIYFAADKTPLFLCAFNEKAGKRQTDYTCYKNVLDTRLQQMLGDEEYE